MFFWSSFDYSDRRHIVMMNEVKADSVYVDRGIECGWSSEDILQPDTWRPLDGQVRICVWCWSELEGIYEPFLVFS